ncbi:TRAF-like superfamily protein [Raphanus sativus]|nr:TRAF-like superfamily protein [Raphanus sativus]
MEKRFSWVLKKFSSSQDEKCYSRPFALAGVNWRLLAYPKRDKKDGHLSLYLEFEDPTSLPPGWSRDVKFTLALFTKAWGKSSIVLGGQCCFDAKNKAWGYTKFVSLAKLHDKSEGFLVNSRLIILAELHVLPASLVVPEETLKITEPLSSQADDESVGKSQRDSSCEETEDSDDDAVSEEGSDDDDDDGPSDDGSFEEDVDNDDASSPLSDDGGEDISLLNHFSALEEASHTIGNDGIKSNSVTAETEVSNDDAPKEDVGDEDSSSLVSNDSGARNRTSLDQVKSLEDASRTSVSVTDNSLITKIQATKETITINGFDVYSSQVESVSYIFKRHPDIALDFRPKNRQIRRAYMCELLSLIEMLCQSPEKLSQDDLSNADDTLADLIDVGFKLDWLMIKLDEVSEKKKKKEKGSEARLRTMEEELLKLKLMFLDLETQMQMEKAEALAAIAPLSFDDIVC